jgi:hypothetical protein
MTATDRPPHCGTCDPRTRQLELPDGTPQRCPRCNPNLSREQADDANARAWRERYGSPPDQLAKGCQYDQCAWRLGTDGISCPDDCQLNAGYRNLPDVKPARSGDAQL